MSAEDVTIVNTPTDETPQVLASGSVDAIAAWQPNSGQALKSLPGSKPIFTSADAPGIIYDYSAFPLKARRLIRKTGPKWFRYGIDCGLLDDEETWMML